MTILVKDEADIIKANIQTHAKLGVDSFVVMDNDSTDGTREILEELKKDIEITIVDEKGLYNQAKWMKKLAGIAKSQNASWVINNDADEFWIPKGDKNLKELLSFKGSVLTCQRYNMILDENSKNGNFFDSEYRVENPIFYKKDNQLEQEKVSIVLTKIGPKVITNPKGLLMIRGGNHKALHLGNLRDYFKNYDKIKKFDEIEVFHYPIRSYEQFEKNIQNRKRLLEDKKHIKMGPHYRRWVKIYNEGKLKEEFENRVAFNQNEIDVLSKYGILRRDENIKNIIEKGE
jgi:hypothetical protein